MYIGLTKTTVWQNIKANKHMYNEHDKKTGKQSQTEHKQPGTENNNKSGRKNQGQKS